MLIYSHAMYHKPVCLTACGACRKSYNLVILCRNYACILHGRSGHPLYEFAKRLVRLKAHGILIAVVTHRLIRENPVPILFAIDKNLEILMAVIIILITVIVLELSKHGQILHIVSVNDGMTVTKISLV